MEEDMEVEYKGINLDDKTVIVIGGTSGIGKAIALGMAQEGANVVPTSRTPERVKETAQQIQDIGQSSIAISTNITREEDIQRLVEKTIQKFGAIDILVNSAGTNVKKKALELSAEEWDQVLEVNLKGAFLACKVIGENMVKNNYGKIINIASMGSSFGITKSSAYCASKGGLVQLTKVLAAEWAESGVNVNAIAPGFFRTELTAKSIDEQPGYRKKIINNTPKKRIGQVEDLIGAAIYLASDTASFVTGEVLRVDGGFSALGI